MTNPWAGDFGKVYTERNFERRPERDGFWRWIVSLCSPLGSALEVGCNVGNNLASIADAVGPTPHLYGADVSAFALDRLAERLPAVTIFREGSWHRQREDKFSLVFTAGVLIHLDQDRLNFFIHQMVRLSSRWVLAVEYEAETDHEEAVTYRDNVGLWRRPYGMLFERAFPSLYRVDCGFLAEREGFDNCTYWLWRKP